MKFPLSTGANWKYNYRTKYSGGPAEVEVNAKAVGWETLKVGAGTFKAMKIIQEHYWRYVNSEGNQSGITTHTYWYAPAIKWWVKYEFSDRNTAGRVFDRLIDELEQFHVNP